VQLDDAFGALNIMSPVWLSFTLNVATATPSTFVFTAVIKVPVVVASPVVMELSPPVLRLVLLFPVFVPSAISLLTEALLVWFVSDELVFETDALLFDPSPFSVFETLALPPVPAVVVPALDMLLLPSVVAVPLLLASPVLILAPPTCPSALSPPVPETFGSVTGSCDVEFNVSFVVVPEFVPPVLPPESWFLVLFVFVWFCVCV
jgi:hypothetical protein